jgi:hypothetical protein
MRRLNWEDEKKARELREEIILTARRNGYSFTVIGRAIGRTKEDTRGRFMKAERKQLAANAEGK